MKRVMSLRARQLEQTHDAILDAATAVLARGLAALSIPAVAAEAGMSVRTVYRHFRTKKDLLDALGARYEKALTIDAPDTLDGVIEGVGPFYGRLDGLAPTWREAMDGPEWDAMRRASAEERLADTEDAIGDGLNALSPEEREHFVRLVTALGSSRGKLLFETVTGLSGQEAAETVAWTLSTLADALGMRQRPRRKKQRRGRK